MQTLHRTKPANIVAECRFCMVRHFQCLINGWSNNHMNCSRWKTKKRRDPKMMWHETFQQDLERLEITREEVEDTTIDRSKW